MYESMKAESERLLDERENELRKRLQSFEEGNTKKDTYSTKINRPGHNIQFHYLMGLGSNTKKIPQNSGKQIRIPEGM